MQEIFKMLETIGDLSEIEYWLLAILHSWQRSYLKPSHNLVFFFLEFEKHSTGRTGLMNNNGWWYAVNCIDGWSPVDQIKFLTLPYTFDDIIVSQLVKAGSVVCMHLILFAAAACVSEI